MKATTQTPERFLCRAMCRFCRNDYASIFNVHARRWEHPYGRKLTPCEADPFRDDPVYAEERT